jgi:hypothetical protein
MKYFKIVSCVLIFIICEKVLAQSDTLIYKNKEKLLGKVIEINDTDIRFKKESNPTGPIYSVDRNKISEIRFSNGQVEQIVQDELSINQEQKILDKRTVIKLEPYGFVDGKLIIGYEKVIKVGCNLDIKASYINTSIGSNIFNQPLTKGFFIKPGIKFLLGTDYHYKGLKYTHPLRGQYIRLDGIFTRFTVYNLMPSNANNYNRSTVNEQVLSYGLLLNYGRQVILGNIISLDYYIGLGFTANYKKYNLYYYSNNNRHYDMYRYFSHRQIGDVPLAAIAGLNIGILLK